MWRTVLVLAMLGLLPEAAFANPPDTSLRPMSRPEAGRVLPEVTLRSVNVGLLNSPRPLPRPKRLAQGAEQTAVMRAQPEAEAGTGRKGSICGDTAIRGEELARIRSSIKGCGIAEPVRVRAVDGVQLSRPATMDCKTAVALRKWVAKGLKPAFGKSGGGVVRLEVAADYSCRTRNGRAGAKISEHGRGRAIDIAGVTLANGKTISVQRDYRKSAGKPLRIAHKAACGVFGTTLGPGSDGFHEDHLHFDTARYRGGPYCK